MPEQEGVQSVALSCTALFIVQPQLCLSGTETRPNAKERYVGTVSEMKKVAKMDCCHAENEDNSSFMK